MAEDGLPLADQLRAVAHLTPLDAVTMQAVRALLTPPQREAGPVGSASLRAGEVVAPPRSPETRAPFLPPEKAPGTLRAKAPLARDRSGTAVRRSLPATVAEPLPAEPPFPAEPPLSGAGPALPPVAPLPPAPIIPLRRARAVFAPMAAASIPGEAVDLPALVDQLAQRKLPAVLPRLPAWSLRRGAQLLLDAGNALSPLRADVQQVGAQLQAVVGRDRLQVLQFAGTPLRGCGRGARRGWSTWRAPARGVPVIVVGDLGIVMDDFDDDWAGPDEWLAFARCLGEAGCPLLVLLPYPPKRLAPALLRAITVLPWTERLDAGHLRRILRDARSAR